MRLKRATAGERLRGEGSWLFHRVAGRARAALLLAGMGASLVEIFALPPHLPSLFQMPPWHGKSRCCMLQEVGAVAAPTHAWVCLYMWAARAAMSKGRHRECVLCCG